MERDFALTLRGKISPVTTQAIGPFEGVSEILGEYKAAYPCGGEKEYIYANERNTSFLSSDILGEGGSVGILTRCRRS